MSKKKDDLVREDEVKEKFRDFLEVLADFKEWQKDSQYQTNLDYAFTPSIVSKELQQMLPDVDFIVDRNLNKNQKKRYTIPGALRRLKDEDLKTLTKIIRFASEYIEEEPDAYGSGSWIEDNSRVHQVSAAIIKELSNRI